MSKKPLELYVVLGEPPASTLAAKVWLEGKGDLYVTVHGHVLAGKYSYHETGFDHRFTELTGRRSGTGKPKRPKLRGMKGYSQVEAMMSAWPLGPTGYLPKSDTGSRRTLIAPAPPIGWYLTVWAIEKGRRDLAAKIAATDPWPTMPIRSSILADWEDPWMLVHDHGDFAE